MFDYSTPAASASAVALVTFLLSVLLTGAVRQLALWRGVLDHPNARSSHERPTPRLGGVAVVLSFLLAMAWLALHGSIPAGIARALVAGTLVVAAIGLADDILGLPASARLVAHFGAAGIAVSAIGVPETIQIGGWVWHWGLAGIVLSATGLVWLINLNNFMDGIDGLCGGHMTAVSLALAGLIAYREPSSPMAGYFLITAAACAGFLVWNWPPARIFLGDSGSGSLGFVYGALALAAVKLGALDLWTALIPFGGFAADSTLTLLRRMLSGQAFLEAHRSHAYQQASRRFGHRPVTLTALSIVLLWLAPAAAAASLRPGEAAIILAIAWIPLVVLAAWFRAGRAEDALPGSMSPASLAGGPVPVFSSVFPNFHRLEYSRVFGRGVIWLTHLTIFASCGLLAFLLRFEFSVPDNHRLAVGASLLIWAVTKSASFAVHRLGHGWWRYVSLPDLKMLLSANAAGSTISAILIWFATSAMGAPWFSRSVLIIDFVLCLLATIGIRVLTRMMLEAIVETKKSVRKRALIYGAGSAGVLLLREARGNAGFPFEICGFVDDEAAKRGTRIHGLPVLGTGGALAEIVRDELIEQVLIAIPDASGAAMSRVVELCEQAGVPFKTVPRQTEILGAGARIAPVRDVKVEDLLGRSAVRLEEDAIRRKIAGKRVLVTGAGGSIGSELCRQIARFEPAALIGLESGETPLFLIEQEMRRRFPSVDFVPEIGSIQDAVRLDEVFVEHQPALVFHAAAYKHVPLMEKHVFEAVENNVFGTRNVALAARNHGATDFVMISTDKAVRPTSVMGATKRVTEIVINALNQGRTKFVSVRFGNVLGSNGSVLPIFQRAISEGGPVQVTDPEVKRFFMTIPEASQLVLQASTMGRGGEIFTLDMGEPVKIADLAQNLIRLSGFKPGVDIRIEYTGLRPGEKLYEELSRIEEGAMPTYHEKIRIFRGPAIGWAECSRRLERLRVACQMRDAALLKSELSALIPDYTPSREFEEVAAASGKLSQPAAAS